MNNKDDSTAKKTIITNTRGNVTVYEGLFLTKREHFAGLFVAAYITNFGTPMTKDAIKDADALLKELEK